MINFSIQNPDRALIDRIIILDISGRNRGELSLNSYDSEVSYIHNMSLDHGIYIATLISEQHIETIKFYVH